MGQAVILFGTLEQQSVFAEMVTMVGCVDLHGVISNTGILRRGTDPADLLNVVGLNGSEALAALVSDRSIPSADRIALLIGGPDFQWR